MNTTRHAPYRLDGPSLVGERPTTRLVTSPEDVADVMGEALRGFIDDGSREVAAVCSLNTRHGLLATDLLSVGSVDHTFMSPREILLAALGHPSVAAIAIAHFHPSGDPTPSNDDEAVTRRISEACSIVGIDLLDHLVLGTGGSWVSLARRGVL